MLFIFVCSILVRLLKPICFAVCHFLIFKLHVLLTNRIGLQRCISLYYFWGVAISFFSVILFILKLSFTLHGLQSILMYWEKYINVHSLMVTTTEWTVFYEFVTTRNICLPFHQNTLSRTEKLNWDVHSKFDWYRLAVCEVMVCFIGKYFKSLGWKFGFMIIF